MGGGEGAGKSYLAALLEKTSAIYSALGKSPAFGGLACCVASPRHREQFPRSCLAAPHMSVAYSWPDACLLPSRSALKAVLDRVTAAAQQKDAQVAAAQRREAAAIAERDAALADKAAAEDAASTWRDVAAVAEAREAALAAAQEQAAAAEARLMQLQASAAADARRWEDRLLTLQAQLQQQHCGGAGAAAQQALLQAEVTELRQLLSAKDQQIGALCSGGSQAGLPGSAITAAALEQERLHAQVGPGWLRAS